MTVEGTRPERDGSPQDFFLAGWRITPSLNLIAQNGSSARLEPRVMHVLLCLAAHAGKLVTKEHLIATVWPDTFVSDQALTTAIWQLRQVFGEKARNCQVIQTIPKTGYRLLVMPTPASEIAATPLAPQSTVPPIDVVDPVSALWPRLRIGAAAVGLLLVALAVAGYVVKAKSRARPAKLYSVLAVLPFANLSGDPEQEYFSDGMTEEMILQLGRLQPDRLGVIARASVMAYKKSGKRIDQIAQELKADYVLEGSVRRDRSRVRVAAHLIDGRTQARVWGEVYEQDWKDILLLQTDIARSLAQQIRLRLTPEQDSTLAAVRPVNHEAYEAYLKGRFYWNKRTREDLYTAISFFEQATRLDPGYALAYVGIADCYWAMHEWNLLNTAEAAAKGRPAAQMAHQLDDSLAQSHAALGAAAMNYDWDWATAEREFKRAIELNPNYAPAHQWYAEYLSAMGRHDEAIATIQRAQALDPYSLIINSVAGSLFLNAGRYDEAIAECRKALEIDPDFHAAHYYLGSVYLQQARSEEALSEFSKAAKIFSRVGGAAQFDLASRATLAARSGNRKEGLRLTTRLAASSVPYSPNGYARIAALYASLGDADRAFSYLDKAIQLRQRNLRLFRINPAFDSLRADPRYQQVLRRLNFAG